MSIPPLVCSTPPPPDQCEDDKEPEDFDLQYNLSQEDDDENYDYGSFSTYNHFQAATEMNKPNVVIETDTRILEKVNVDEKQLGKKDDIEIINDSLVSKFKLEDEVIEDLDLKVDEEVLSNSVSTNNKSPVESEESEASKSENIIDKTDIPNIEIIDNENLTPCEFESPSRELSTDLPNLEQTVEPLSFVDEIAADDTCLKVIDDLPVIENVPDLPEESVPFEEPLFSSEILQSKEPELQNDDDDFGDFDDFKFTSVTDKPAVAIESCENPWSNTETANDDFGDFGEFKASFDDNSESNITNTITEPDTAVRETVEQDVVKDNLENEDDFGDFDDFKSSSVETQSAVGVTIDEDNGEICPVLSLKSLENESEFMESVNSLLSCIFDEEIAEPEEVFEGRLETQLGITWGHILDVDVRQPYMVHWNSSLAQKTLLKALCIDSRNILFGPKWSSNMPKYAANLSAAPLQPQKQAPQTSCSQSEPVVPDKNISKTPSSWSDPFTSEGQESCNPDASRDTTTEPRPTDLDVFEASISAKPDKIFCSTLGVQPIRQINLPDTHIFTPTDSETPRSKTIHYESPTVLLPQTAISNKATIERLPPQPSTSAATGDSEDYWEFQDFKGPTTSTARQSNDEKTESEPIKSYETQLLQPIKIEPIIPTLNWPDPGEVKETFDDFSDFVSNSTLGTNNGANDDKLESPAKSIQSDIQPMPIQPDQFNKIIEKSSNKIPVVDTLDDDFDTFQSAPSASNNNFANLSNNTTDKLSPQKKSDFDFAFPKIENAKEKDIVPQNPMLLTNPQSSNFTRTTDLAAKMAPPLPQAGNQMTKTSLLQPMPSSSSTLQNHQKSGQILQPMSLESISQINWPNPGIDLQDLSRFNPVDTVHALKSDLSTNSHSKGSSPVHTHKSIRNTQDKRSHNIQSLDDDWGDFVSSVPQQTAPKTQQTFVDEDEWTDFISSPSVKPQNGLNTISLNVHTNIQKTANSSKFVKNQMPLDIPTLSIITPKSSNHKTYNDRHFENL